MASGSSDRALFGRLIRQVWPYGPAECRDFPAQHAGEPDCPPDAGRIHCRRGRSIAMAGAATVLVRAVVAMCRDARTVCATLGGLALARTLRGLQERLT